MRTSLTTCRRAALALLLSLVGCVEPYVPDVINAPNTYLVVDGFINGNGRSTFRLSRATNVATTTAPPAEPGASVAIVDNAGGRYSLRELVPGTYRSDSLVLGTSRQYQLRITTSTNATYESDLVPLKVTPPLDKFNWARQGDQVQIHLSTHDPTGQSRFYRWRYTETWEFNSAYKSVLEYRNGIVQDRTTPIYTCWRTEQPSFIRQASTASLSQDAVSDFSLTSFSDRAERVRIRYSILVTQYAETAEEFAYLEVLRKNTEAVGTVNDPLPSQLTGNVHRIGTATTEPVLGFVSAHTVQQQRLFLTPQVLGLPPSWAFDSPYANCIQVTEPVPNPDDKFPNIIHIPYTRVFAGPGYVPVDYYVSNGDKAGYVGSTRECVDCRLRGTNIKPSFW